jgi:ferric-dicitrate binding protein FerR (iron transport regulator)
MQKKNDFQMRFDKLMCITNQKSKLRLLILPKKLLKMLNQNEIERISRYINGDANTADSDWVEGLFSHRHHNQGLKHHLEHDWENVLQKEQDSNADLNSMLDRVHHLIRKKESQKRKTLVLRMTSLYMKIAAVLLVPVIVAGSIYVYSLSGSFGLYADQQVNSVIYAPMGSRVSFNLPDGTTGWLNSGSKLAYSLPFSKNRKVALEGEAWFDVLHNEEQPFEISAGESKVKVLGTSFNVSAYPQENYVEVVLQDGKVEFSDQTLDEHITMKPSERLTLKDDKLELNSVDPMKYRGWTDGKLIFRGDDMAEVARRIERWYDVKVEILDNDLLQFSFRATFMNDSLEEVLKLISMTSPIDYKVLQRIQLSDGTYEKEKIILQKRKK